MSDTSTTAESGDGRVDFSSRGRPGLTALDLMGDVNLLQPWFAGSSWDCWRTILRAANGLPLTADELVRFRVVAGHRDPELASLRCSDRMRVELEYESDRPLMGAALMVGVYGTLNQPIYRLDSEGAGGLTDTLPPHGRLVCETAPLNLTPGRYLVNLALMMHGTVIDHVEQAATFDVEASDFFGTGMLPPHHEVPCLLPQRWWVEGA